jgi:ATP-dependent DNA helicase RecG
MTVIYSMEYEAGESGQINGTLNGTLSGTLSGTLKDTLNEKQNRVLDFIAATPGVQTQIVIDQLAIPRDTLNKILKVLTDRELIERRGSKKTGGYYVKK